MLTHVHRLGLAFAVALATAAAAAATAAAAPITIVAKPAAFTNEPNATFTFTGAPDYMCSLDGAPAAACGQTFYAPGLGEGQHSLTVSTGPGCEAGACPPATYSWTEDFTPPDTQLTGQPPAVTNSTTAQFSFTSSDPTASFRCSLNGATPSACTSPVTYSGLSAATRKFAVFAVDPAGNASIPAQEAAWTVDLTPPSTTILSGPDQLTSKATATFTYKSSESNSTFECSLDGGAFAACDPSGYTTPSLADGSHTARVRAVDPAGNRDPNPATTTWTVAATPPAPPVLTVTHKPSFRLTRLPGRPSRHARDARAAAVVPGTTGPSSERFITGLTLLIQWHPSDSRTTGMKVTAVTDGTQLSTALSGSVSRAVAYGRETCYEAVATNAAGVESAPATACATVPLPVAVLRCDYLFGYCGDYDSGANLKATQVVADPQAFGGAYMTFARGGGQRLDYQLALCNAGWGPSNGGCTNQAYRLIVLVATKCPTCGSVVVDVKGWDHTAGNGLPDDTSAPTSYSHTVSLTTHKGVLHKQLVFVPVPLGAAANETQLTITRASGTPRIEGLWADEAP